MFSFSLPQSLNNYELTIALYLVFSRYGKVVFVKASRDSAHRPFGFIEFLKMVLVYYRSILYNSRRKAAVRPWLIMMLTVE